MNAGNMPSELSSYIVRQTENVNVNQNKKKKSNGKYFWMAGALALVLAISFGWYGIEKKAAAFEVKPAELALSVAEEAEKMTEPIQNTAEAEQGEVLAVIPEETQSEEIQSEEKQYEIPNGDELFAYLAKQEVTTDYEDNLSGLLWNYELIADIRKRVQAEEEAERAFQEEYHELLVTMGMDEAYVSQDPELPEYLTKTYNPLMDIELSQEEMSELLRLVEAEAPSEDIYGKILVANVVLNRVNNEKMANTVTGVIYEKIGGSAQFSPTAISWYWNSIVVTDSTREAVARCLSGEDYSNGALYFHAWEKNPNKHLTSAWMRDLECLFTHGGHRFFR